MSGSGISGGGWENLSGKGGERAFFERTNVFESSWVFDSSGGGRREERRGTRRSLLALGGRLKIYEVLCDGRWGSWRGSGHRLRRVHRRGLLCGRKGERRGGKRMMDGESPWGAGVAEDGEGKKVCREEVRDI